MNLRPASSSSFGRRLPSPLYRPERSQVQIVLHSFWEDRWRNVYAGALDVRPPDAPTGGCQRGPEGSHYSRGGSWVKVSPARRAPDRS